MKNTAILLLILVIATCLFTACATPRSPVEDIEWVLTSFTIDSESREVLPETEITVFFEGDTREFGGNAGCNHYAGSYEIDGRDLDIPGPVAVTEMWCGDEIGRQEQEYLEVLLKAESFEVDGDILRIEGSKGVLNFERG
jgi:heat shock protein HslJ